MPFHSTPIHSAPLTRSTTHPQPAPATPPPISSTLPQAEPTDFEHPFSPHAHKPRLPLAAPFNPAPELTETLLLNRIDPALTLSDLASLAGITLDDLFKWFETPAIAERIKRLHTHALAHVQEHALCTLRQALPVLTRVLQECDYALAKHAIQNQDSKGHELHRRIGETGMRAAALLHRLATNPASPTGRPPEKELKPKPNSKQEKKPLPPPAPNQPPKESYSALLARLFPENVSPPAPNSSPTPAPNQPLPSEPCSPH